MAADAIDLDYLKSREQRSGLLLSFWAFGQKFADAIGAGIAGVLLAFFGFSSNAVNTPEALMGVKIVYIVIPALLFFASVPFYWNYPISPEKQKRIRAVLDRRAAKSGATAS
jgi:GPH family glycoside/pentoside/hexuronide:cation symporter